MAWEKMVFGQVKSQKNDRSVNYGRGERICDEQTERGTKPN